MKFRNPVTALLCLFVVLLLTYATAQGQKVETGYDKDADFAQYKTFAWVKRDVPPPNPLLAALIANNIEVELKEKGLRRVDRNPDLLVSFYGGSTAQSAFAPADPGFTALGGEPITGAWGGSASGTPLPHLMKGTLAIDLVDARQQHLVWRAVANTNLDYENRNKMLNQVNKAIAEMFKKYPPEK